MIRWHRVNMTTNTAPKNWSMKMAKDMKNTNTILMVNKKGMYNTEPYLLVLSSWYRVLNLDWVLWMLSSYDSL